MCIPTIPFEIPKVGKLSEYRGENVRKCNIKIPQLALNSLFLRQNDPPATRAIAVHWLALEVSLATPSRAGVAQIVCTENLIGVDGV